MLDPRTLKAISLYWRHESKKESKTSTQVWTKPSAVSVDVPEDVFCCLVTKSCPTLLQPHGLQPARLLYGISQVRILEWVAISSSRVSSQHRAQTHVSCRSHIGRQILYHSTKKVTVYLSRQFTSFKSQTLPNTSYFLGTVLTGMMIKTVFVVTHTSVPTWKADRSSGRVIQDSFVYSTTNESRGPYSQEVYNLVREMHKHTKKKVRKG